MAVTVNWLRAGLFGGALLTTTALSSVATQYVAEQLSYHPALGARWQGLYQPFAWATWQLRPWAADVRPAFLWPNVGAGLLMPAAATPLGIRHFRNNPRKPKPFPDVHGSADWANLEEIEATGLLNNDVGIYIGAWENPETKVIHYLRDKSGAHVAGVAPTRSGKGLGWVLPNLLSYTESCLVYDPKGELWQLTAGWRKSIDQNVLRWQPGHPDLSCSFNFLSEIRLGTLYEVADAQKIVVMLIDQDGSGFNNHWDKAAFGFMTGLILHCLHIASDKGSTTSLPAVTALLSSPMVNPDMLCQSMAASKYGAAINAAGVDQLKRDEKERGAVLSTVKTYLSLFLDPIISRNTSTSSFKIRDLMDHRNPTSLYILVPGDDSTRMLPLVRLMVTMILNQVISKPIAFDLEQHPIRTHRHNMLLMMEEFPDLRRLAVFQRTMAVMAGAGLTAFLVMQDREQLLGAYGEHQTIMANTHLVGAYAPNEGKTAAWISHELGNKTINLEQYSESGKRGGRLSHLSHSFSPVARPLLTPDEVKRMPSPRKKGTRIVSAGRMIIMATGHKPIYGRQILYFEDPVFLARSRILPPLQSDDLELVRCFKIGKLV